MNIAELNIVGLVGGIAPDSTVDSCRTLIAGHRERRGGAYPHILITSIDRVRLDPELLDLEVTAIRSRGAGEIAEGATYATGTCPAAEDTRDIVSADGFFVYAPEVVFFDKGFEGGLLPSWTNVVP